MPLSGEIPVPVPQLPLGYDELEALLLSRGTNLDAVTVLREVVLIAHSRRVSESRKVAGVLVAALDAVERMRRGGIDSQLPQCVWALVVALPVEQAWQLVGRVNAWIWAKSGG